jgi:hypothetical protein
MTVPTALFSHFLQASDKHQTCILASDVAAASQQASK